jgi:hypothetical protein
LAGLVLGVHVVGAAAAPRGLLLGVTDDSFLSSDAGLRETWMNKAKWARANLAMLTVSWSGIAPTTRPAGFDPADPAAPAYDWAALDGAIRSAAQRGMTPVLDINYAPAWAEGAHRPSYEKVPAGAWDPQPKQLGLFARALARRYSGHFRDAAGARLPRVRYFEVWAEENLSIDLAPLWKGGKLVGPAHYRVLLNEAYRAIHSVNSGAKVIVGGLSPYGDRGRSWRVPPVLYWRSLLCLRGSRLRPVKCRNPAHFDIAAHNPINVGGPETHAISPLDVSTPDIGRITKIVRKAVRTRRLLPAKPKPFWATEIWWDSKPPDPRGVPVRRHARFVTKSIYLLWRQGASAFIWWYVRDQSHASGFAGTQQSGLFFRSGEPKLAFRAYRFPFIAGRDRRGQLFVWGKAPAPGRVVVERRTRRGWTPLLHLRAGSNRIFTGRIEARGNVTVRARQGSQRSLPWQTH